MRKYFYVESGQTKGPLLKEDMEELGIRCKSMCLGIDVLESEKEVFHI